MSVEAGIPSPPSDEDAEWIKNELESFAKEAVKDRGMHPWQVSMLVVSFAKEFRMQAILNGQIVGSRPSGEGGNER